ncbi:MAG: hypothetical protein ACXWCX_27480, partial [Burkholderiales bacterium]
MQEAARIYVPHFDAQLLHAESVPWHCPLYEWVITLRDVSATNGMSTVVRAWNEKQAASAEERVVASVQSIKMI